MTNEAQSPNSEQAASQSFVICAFVIPSGFVIQVSSFFSLVIWRTPQI
jgi:hypothetical protein